MGYLILQTLGDYESLGVKSMLIGTILVLGSAIIYLYKSKETAIKEKDAKIMEVIKEYQIKNEEITKEHQADLRESAADMKTLSENYYKFTQTIKEIVNGK